MVLKWTMLLLGISFNSLLVIRSYPGAFLWLRSPYITFWISFGVSNLIGCFVYVVIVSAFRCFLFFFLSFGLNVFSKCYAKIFTFSVSLHHQVWFVFVIGVMRCVGCFTRMVALQSEQLVSSAAVKLWRYVGNVSSLIFILYFNFLFTSLYLRLSSECHLICHHILSFLFP
jgi:hypothetical protein